LNRSPLHLKRGRQGDLDACVTHSYASSTETSSTQLRQGAWAGGAAAHAGLLTLLSTMLAAKPDVMSSILGSMWDSSRAWRH
jgi:hypothetical protein